MTNEQKQNTREPFFIKISQGEAKALLPAGSREANRLGSILLQENKSPANTVNTSLNPADAEVRNAALALLCPAVLLQVGILDKGGELSRLMLSIVAVPEQEGELHNPILQTAGYYFIGHAEDGLYEISRAEKMDLLNLFGVYFDAGSSVWQTNLSISLSMKDMALLAACADVLLRKEYIAALNHEKPEDDVTIENVHALLEDTARYPDGRWMLSQLLQLAVSQEYEEILAYGTKETAQSLEQLIQTGILKRSDNTYTACDKLKIIKNCIQDRVATLSIQAFYMEEDGNVTGNRCLFIRDFRFLHFLAIESNEDTRFASVSLDTALDIIRELLLPQSAGLSLSEGVTNAPADNRGQEKYKTCNQCQTIYEGDINFCVRCGKKLEATTSEPVQQKFCGSCGYVLEPQNRFCINCGSAVTPK